MPRAKNLPAAKRRKKKVLEASKGFWGMRIRPSAVGGVRGVTMPELAGPDEQIDVLKVDIEGSELDLFGRRTEWLGRVRVLVIELHDRFRPGCRDLNSR